MTLIAEGNRCWFQRVLSGIGLNAFNHLWRKCQEYRCDLCLGVHFVERFQYRLVQVIRVVRFFHRSGADGLRSDPEFYSVSPANNRAFCDSHSDLTIVHHILALRLNLANS